MYGVALCVWAGAASAQTAVPEQLQGVEAVDRRGAPVTGELGFRAHDGAEVTLGSFFTDGKPVLLTMNYYQCRMLCTEQLNGLVEGLRTLEWTPGKEFRLVTVSIDTREGMELASAKRASYLESLDREGADWHFLTGSAESIHQLAEDVGFRFKYDAETDQYAHPPVLMFLSPEGKVMQYLFGKQFKSRDLKFALMDASKGQIGSTFEQLVWSCFHYDETVGAYTPFAKGIMRLGGGLTVLVLSTVLMVWWRRERRVIPLVEQLT